MFDKLKMVGYYNRMVQSAETIAPVFRGKDEPLINRVWYGVGDGTKKVGEVIRGQMPDRWRDRIITTINEKVIPKLTPEQLAWVAKHQKGIEAGAAWTGVGITTVELVAAYATTVMVVDKFAKSLQLAKERRWYKKNTQFVDMGPKLPKMPVIPAGPSSKLSADIQHRIYTHYFSDRNETIKIAQHLLGRRGWEHVERGISATRKTRLAVTVEAMLVISELPAMRFLLKQALKDAHPDRRPPVGVQRFFTFAYHQAARKYGWDQAGMGEAKTLYEQWVNKQDKIGYKLMIRRSNTPRSFIRDSTLPDPTLEHMGKFIKPGPGAEYYYSPLPSQLWQDAARHMQLDKEPSVLVRLRMDQMLERLYKRIRVPRESRKSVEARFVGQLAQGRRTRDSLQLVHTKMLKDAIALDPTVDWKKPDIAAKIYRYSRVYPHIPFEQSAGDLAQLLDRAWEIRGKEDMPRLIKAFAAAREVGGVNEMHSMATQILEHAHQSDKKFRAVFANDGTYYEVHDQMYRFAQVWIDAFNAVGTSNLLEPVKKFRYGLNVQFLLNPVEENR